MSASPPFIEVVAAVVRRQATVLLCQRHDGEHLPLLWEFPGGKIDAGETPEGALEREIAEELGVAAVVGEEVTVIEHHYPEKSVRIRFLVADIGEATPRPIVHREVRWIPLDELHAFEVPPANRSVVKMLRDGVTL